jgi:hypothetical protein
VIPCAVYRNLLTAAILAGEDPGWPLGAHTGHCLRCQAHTASVRATRRRLSELGQEQISIPTGFGAQAIKAQVMDSLGAASGQISPKPRWKTAAGASMAAALVAAFWMRRRATARA